jgi:hypothetical protein
MVSLPRDAILAALQIAGSLPASFSSVKSRVAFHGSASFPIHDQSRHHR